MKRRLALAAAALPAWLAACGKQTAAPAGAPAPAPAPSPAPDPVQAQQAFETAAREGAGFTVGQTVSARLALVFFDPQCPHCAALWRASRPLLDRIRMQWMPVAFISAASAPQGALLMAAADPVATMDQHEASLAAGQGGLPVPAQADQEGLAKVKANTALWQRLGGSGVPYVLFRAGAEGPYGIHSGSASTAELSQMLGV